MLLVFIWVKIWGPWGWVTPDSLVYLKWLQLGVMPSSPGFDRTSQPLSLPFVRSGVGASGLLPISFESADRWGSEIQRAWGGLVCGNSMRCGQKVKPNKNHWVSLIAPAKEGISICLLQERLSDNLYTDWAYWHKEGNILKYSNLFPRPGMIY